MALNGPTVQIVWMNNDEIATIAISVTQLHPTARWGKVPFGAQRAPVARAPFAPSPRPEEARPQLQENVPARQNGLLAGLFGGKDESEPDIDYETPAFLRNQAD